MALLRYIYYETFKISNIALLIPLETLLLNKIANTSDFCLQEFAIENHGNSK